MAAQLCLGNGLAHLGALTCLPKWEAPCAWCPWRLTCATCPFTPHVMRGCQGAFVTVMAVLTLCQLTIFLGLMSYKRRHYLKTALAVMQMRVHQEMEAL